MEVGHADLLLDLAPLDHLVPVLQLAPQLLLLLQDARLERVQVLLEELVLHPLQGGHAQQPDDEVGACAVDEERDQRVGGHVQQDQAAHQLPVVVVVVDVHGQRDADGPFQPREGQHHHLAPAHPLAQPPQVLYEDADREESGEQGRQVDVDGDHQLALDTELGLLDLDDVCAHQHAGDHEDAGLCDEDQVVPKAGGVLLGFPEEPGLAEGVHVEGEDGEGDDAGDPEVAVLCDEVDGVGEDDHECDSERAVVDHALDAVDGDCAGHHAEGDAAEHVLEEEREVVPVLEDLVHLLLVLDELEDHHAGAVVEQRLALDQRGDLLRRASALQLVHERKDVRAGQHAPQQQRLVPTVDLRGGKGTF